MAAVDAPDDASVAEIKDWILARTEHPEFMLLWARDQPEHWFSPARRNDEEMEAHTFWWNYGEELCLAFNREIDNGDV